MQQTDNVHSEDIRKGVELKERCGGVCLVLFFLLSWQSNERARMRKGATTTWVLFLAAFFYFTALD